MSKRNRTSKKNKQALSKSSKPNSAINLHPQSKTHVPRLVALPVAGDAFLLIRNEKNSLIDGGSSGDRLYKTLTEELGPQPILHRIICTHKDSDHARGLAEMLDGTYAFSLKEVWLPGSWGDVIEAIVSNPSDFYDSVAQDLGEALSDDPGVGSPLLKDAIQRQKITGNISVIDTRGTNDKKNDNAINSRKNSHILEEDARRTNIKNTLGCINSALKDINNAALSHPYLHTSRMRTITSCNGNHSSDQLATHAAQQVFLKLIEAAKIIFTIANGAINRGAIIRWFDAKSYYKNSVAASGGDPGELVPLNSIELISPPASGLNAGEFLYLTVINLHSLSFYAPETDQYPGCVFSADGILDGDLPSPVPKHLVAFTAPHHGSASNAPDAYTNMEKMLKGPWHLNSILIRSDRWVAINPCAEYKTAEKRLCTLCPKKEYEYKAAKLTVTNTAEWDFLAAQENQKRKCDCL